MTINSAPRTLWVQVLITGTGALPVCVAGFDQFDHVAELLENQGYIDGTTENGAAIRIFRHGCAAISERKNSSVVPASSIIMGGGRA